MAIQKVLCVDDSQAELDLIRQVVQRAGKQTFAASSGLEAINLAKRELPDLIFLDIVMSGMDGFAVMRELQKDTVTKQIPVVFVSSKNQKADQAWAKMQGAKGFIPKPVSEQAILDELNKF